MRHAREPRMESLFPDSSALCIRDPFVGFMGTETSKICTRIRATNPFLAGLCCRTALISRRRSSAALPSL